MATLLYSTKWGKENVALALTIGLLLDIVIVKTVIEIIKNLS